VIQRCDTCGHYAHPPVTTCDTCLNPDTTFTWTPVSGRGTLRTWTTMHDAFLPGFRERLPYVVADVELEEQEGLRLYAELVDGASADKHVGDAVALSWDDVAEGLALPQFNLSGGAS
jgi:uncharacterized OB-fold protein